MTTSTVVHEGLDGVLAVLRRVADVVLLRSDDGRETAPQRLDDARGVVDRQRRLRHVGELLRVDDVEALDVRDRLDEMHAAVALAHRALDLGVAGVADHHDLAPLLAHLRDLDVDLRHQRTGRVEHGEPPRHGVGLHGLRHAVRREHDGRAARHLVELVDEHRALPLQVLDDGPVVDDLVAHVDRRPMQRRAPARRSRSRGRRRRRSRGGWRAGRPCGQGAAGASARRWRKLSRMSRIAPTVIALSATLNAG